MKKPEKEKVQGCGKYAYWNGGRNVGIDQSDAYTISRLVEIRETLGIHIKGSRIKVRHFKTEIDKLIAELKGEG